MHLWSLSITGVIVERAFNANLLTSSALKDCVNMTKEASYQKHVGLLLTSQISLCILGLHNCLCRNKAPGGIQSNGMEFFFLTLLVPNRNLLRPKRLQWRSLWLQMPMRLLKLPGWLRLPYLVAWRRHQQRGF